jgi:hypothetical protein
MTTYTTEIQYYTTNQQIIGNCNVITFVNTGTITMYVNNFPVTSGNSFSIAGNQDEIDVSNYQIDFRGSTVGEVYVIKKVNR